MLSTEADRRPERVSAVADLVRGLEVALSVIVLIALGLLAVRSYTRIEPRWDAWNYHIPFAARLGGLHVPFRFNEDVQPMWQGFPVLAETLMGLLWRITGSINATGVVNALGLGLFLFVCDRKLNARFFVVAPIALTAPMVIIHTATNYVDLFSNAMLAIGLSTLAYIYLFDRKSSSLLKIGLAGLVAACWSKDWMVPFAVIAFALFLYQYGPVFVARTRRLTRPALWIVGAAVLASLPYVKNIVEYHNPVWPINVPVAGDVVPHAETTSVEMRTAPQRPLALANASQPELFIRSLFEIGHPTHYPDRPRWIIDQGNAAIAFRSGGFWNIGVAVYLLTAGGLLIFVKRRKGVAVVAVSVGMLAVLSVMPQSHELRYFMFLPLCWAALVGMLYPSVKLKQPALCVALLLMVGGLFLYMAKVNHNYYDVEHTSYDDIARYWGADKMWPYMRPGYTYCVVGKVPAAVLFTGPTMHEFPVVDRIDETNCPAGTVHIVGNSVNYPK